MSDSSFVGGVVMVSNHRHSTLPFSPIKHRKPLVRRPAFAVRQKLHTCKAPQRAVSCVPGVAANDTFGRLSVTHT